MKLLLAAATAAATLAATGAGAVSLIPLAENPGGQSPEASAEQWSKWSFSFDRVADGGDPINDTTGEFQNQKQTYPVFLLGGTSGFSAERSFTIPAGKVVMIPLFNTGCFGGNESAPDPAIGSPCNQANIDYSLAFLDAVDTLFLRIDGKDFVNATSASEVDAIDPLFRIGTDIFPAEIAPNSWVTVFIAPEQVPGGLWTTVDNYGFYAFAKLGRGTHVLEYGGGHPGFDSPFGSIGAFFNSTNATITVAPVPLPAALPLLAAGLGALGFAARQRSQS
jgi:hypothetical protein